MGLWILIGLNIVANVHGFSNGFFPEVCGSMLPKHNRLNGPFIPAQTDKAPFDVLPEPGNKGDPITVYLKSDPDTSFQGFMLEARENIETVIQNRTVGQFIALDEESRLLSCYDSEGTAVSHRNNFRKTLIRVNWTGPDEGVNITFRATFLKNYDEFWTNVDATLVFPPQTTPAPTNTPGIETSAPPVPNSSYTLEGIATMSVNSFPAVLNMRPPHIFFIVVPSGPLLHHFIKVSHIFCCLLCAAFEISSVVLFCHPIQVHLVALVCVAMVINFIKLVIVCLPIGPTHELKEICDHAAKVCSVGHLIFTYAVIFVGVLEIKNCEMYIGGSWFLKTLITSAVWTFLFIIWDLVSSTQSNTILGRSKKGSPQNSQRWRQHSKEKKLCGAEGTVAAVSVIFIFGSLCFAIANTAGVLLLASCM